MQRVLLLKVLRPPLSHRHGLGRNHASNYERREGMNQLKGSTPTKEERAAQKAVTEQLRRDNERNARKYRPQAVRNPEALKYGGHKHVKLQREES